MYASLPGSFSFLGRMGKPISHFPDHAQNNVRVSTGGPTQSVNMPDLIDGQFLREDKQ